MKKLTPKQQKIIEQVAATMAIEDMPLTKQCEQNLVSLAIGEKTIEQLIIEIKQRYQHG